MKVLIAEDDAVSRRLLRSYLEKWGHEVVETADGAEAWRRFEADDFPIVISDWIMPEVDGVELVRRIRAAAKPNYVYTILLTAKSQKEHVVAGMDAGADDFVTKPFDRDELRVRLREGERIIRLERSLAEQNRALRETQAALVQSEKLASLGQLAAGMAHEINNPVAAVTNNLAVLRRDVAAALRLLDRYRRAREALAAVEPALADELAALEAEADLDYLQKNLEPLFDKSLGGLGRVRDIVRNLRDFAKLDEAERNELDLAVALDTTLEMLHHDITAKELSVVRDYRPVPPLVCHPGKINQVLLNLLTNSVAACAPGGRIDLATRRQDDATVIEIRDNGSGIAPEHMKRLFEPFFTTKPVGQGMGLGLAISYGIVRDHGGTIEAESQPGHGSTFRIRLPDRAEPAERRS
ncbi:MAG TPA: response regulator [Pirellulales bacterium]|jgi:signal transduction histidine kinase|nr:response regulator [Pirellulales bacterium]